jgi:hypothetical protein
MNPLPFIPLELSDDKRKRLPQIKKVEKLKFDTKKIDAIRANLLP